MKFEETSSRSKVCKSLISRIFCVWKKKFLLLIQTSSLRSQCFLRGDFYKEEGEKIRGPFDAEQSITCNFLPLNALLAVMDQVIPEIVFSGTWNQGLYAN